MTAVVAMSPGGYPVQIGDLLVSSTVPSQKEVTIPTVGKFTNPPPPTATPTYYPTSIRQKIAIVGENISIGWAGNYIAARVVINKLRELNHRSDMTLKDVVDYLSNLDSWTREQELSVLGHVLAEDGGPFSYNSWCGTSPAYGDVRAAGSGAKDVLSFIDQIPEEINAPMLNPMERAVASALGLSGTLINEELTTRNTLASHFGGGYEISTRVKRNFEKVGDITYLWWTLKAQGQGFLLSKGPYHVQKYIYQGDLLIVHVLDMRPEPNKGKQLHRRVHVVNPVYRDPRPNEYLQLQYSTDFNSRFMCNLVAYLNTRGEIHLLSQVYYSSDGKCPVRVNEQDDQIVVGFHDKFLNDIGDAIRGQEIGGQTVVARPL